MTEVVLSGQLVCGSDEEVSVVLRLLPRHIEQTRREAGCISFEVRRTVNPRVWQVDERFVDAGAFDVHQKRVSLSEWGRATAGIERRFTIEGIGAGGS